MKLCRRFVESGHCKRGAQCTYAHGDHELGMDRPHELRNVTLGDMNKRKKGKNMVTGPQDVIMQAPMQDMGYTAPPGWGQQGIPPPNVYYVDGGPMVDYGWQSIPPTQAMAWGPGDYPEQYHGNYNQAPEPSHKKNPGAEPAQTEAWKDAEQVENASWNINTSEAPPVTSDSSNTSSPDSRKKSPKALSVDIEAVRQGVAENDKPAPEAALPSSTKGAAGGRKEPSPFLPLSPSLDDWADEPTPTPERPSSMGRESQVPFSWADTVSTDRRGR